MRRLVLALTLVTSAATAQEAPTLPPATVVGRFTAPEARQGVAVDARFFYAIDNNVIGKYDKASGKQVGRWEGPRALFPHMNSCVVERTDLICAASNHSQIPMASAVEIFDTRTLKHVRSIALPPYPGSLTWIERRGRDWWALFANYSADRGGEPGRDHRWTLLMRLDDQFRALQSWHFPADVLAKFAPMSSSGGSWGDDGLLYVTGHDDAELYALRLPEAGTVLEHVATIPLATAGQAFAWDRSKPRTLWSIDRKTRSVVVSKIAPIGR